MMIPSFLMPLLSNAILLLCGYKSFKALESSTRTDDTKWLTFWFCNSFLGFAKAILDYVSMVVPFYNEAYLGAIVFLAFLGGSDLVYKQIRPLLKEYESAIDSHLSQAEKQAKLAAEQAQAKFK